MKTTLLTKKLGIVATTMMLVCTSPLTYASYDEKTLPGSGCMVTNGAHQARARYWDNGLKNATSGFLSVTCPLVQDEQNQTTLALDFLDVKVQQWAGQTTRCWLSIEADDATPTVTISAQRMGPGKIIWYGDYNVYGGGYYVVRCMLPPWARLIGVFWSENPGGTPGHETDID